MRVPERELLATVRRVDDSTVESSGRATIAEVNAALDLSIPEDEGFETVAGLVLARLGSIPPLTSSQASASSGRTRRAWCGARIVNFTPYIHFSL